MRTCSEPLRRVHQSGSRNRRRPPRATPAAFVFSRGLFVTAGDTKGPFPLTRRAIEFPRANWTAAANVTRPTNRRGKRDFVLAHHDYSAEDVFSEGIWSEL